MDGSNSLQTRYLRGTAIDQLFARIETDTPTDKAYWLLPDHLGSVRHVLDDNGTIKNEITYNGFGKITAETDSNYRGRYTFTSREWDTELDLQYNRARYYDPNIGRWTSEDPLGFGAGDANLYRYVTNAPTGRTDPSGLDYMGLTEVQGRMKFGGNWLDEKGRRQFKNEYGLDYDPNIGSMYALLKDSYEPRANWYKKVIAHVSNGNSFESGFAKFGPEPYDPNIKRKGMRKKWTGVSPAVDAWLNRWVGINSLARMSLDKNGRYVGIGQPGFAEGFTPVWGPFRAALDDFQKGNYVMGVVNAAFLAGDLLIIGYLARSSGRGIVKGATGAVRNAPAAPKLVGEALKKAKGVTKKIKEVIKNQGLRKTLDEGLRKGAKEVGKRVRSIWERFSIPVFIGRGGIARSPFHVVWQVGNRFFDAAGEGIAYWLLNPRVTFRLLWHHGWRAAREILSSIPMPVGVKNNIEAWLTRETTFPIRVPALNPRLAAMTGHNACSCVTAAWNAVSRANYHLPNWLIARTLKQLSRQLTGN